MKFTFTVALATLVALPMTASALMTPMGHVYVLHAQNGSGEYGTFALKPHGNKTTVEVHLVGAPAYAQPAHLHPGTCAKLNPAPKYPLKNVVDGVSETSIDVPMSTLVKAGLALNVHASTTNLGKYVACGNVAP
jgi:hypothetical protein